MRRDAAERGGAPASTRPDDRAASCRQSARSRFSVFGLWLVDEAGYGFGDAWIVAALVLWVVSGALGGPAGKRSAMPRELAERLAAEGDAAERRTAPPSRAATALVLNYLSFGASSWSRSSS